MSLNVTLRIAGMLLFGAAGLVLGLYLSQKLYGPDPRGFNELVLPLTFFGALFGLLVIPYLTVYPLRWLRSRIKRMPASELVWGTMGLSVGLVLGAVLSVPLSALPEWPGRLAPTVVALVLGYLGAYAGAVRGREIMESLRFVWHTESAGAAQTGGSSTSRLARAEGQPFATGPLHSGNLGSEALLADRYLLVDTSAIIDGRIADISKTGFLDGTLLVPRFVLNELQHIADSPDPLRRARGRRGLDMLNRLQKESVAPIQISEVDADDIPEVDGKLIKIARIYKCPIITNDFNLNRVAEIQGVKVLNINELANAVKPVVLPGEEMSVHVIQEGKELGQGVGYLDDGTMVVVENGKKYINSDVDVVVTRVLQTVAGRMIFAQMKNGKS
jgi:uncharacterized protein YacL